MGAGDSEVEVVTLARPGRCGVRTSSEAWNFLSSKLSRRAAKPSLLLFNGHRGYCQGLKCSGAPFWPLTFSGAVTENEWRYTSAPPYVPSWRGQGFHLYVGMCETWRLSAPFNDRFNPLALEMDISIVAHHLCKMWIFYEPKKLTIWNTRHK